MIKIKLYSQYSVGLLNFGYFFANVFFSKKFFFIKKKQKKNFFFTIIFRTKFYFLTKKIAKVQKLLSRINRICPPTPPDGILEGRNQCASAHRIPLGGSGGPGGVSGKIESFSDYFFHGLLLKNNDFVRCFWSSFWVCFSLIFEQFLSTFGAVFEQCLSSF